MNVSFKRGKNESAVVTVEDGRVCAGPGWGSEVAAARGEEVAVAVREVGKLREAGWEPTEIGPTSSSEKDPAPIGPLVRAMGPCVELKLWENLKLADLRLLADSAELTTLTLNPRAKGCLRSLAGLEGCARLERLELRSHTPLETLPALPRLKALTITEMEGVVSLELLSKVPGLEALGFGTSGSGATLATLAPIARCAQLRRLDVQGAYLPGKNKGELEQVGLAKLPFLRELPIRELLLADQGDLGPVGALPPELEALTIWHSWLTDLGPLRGLRRLRRLILTEAMELSDLTPLAQCTSLEELDISGSKVTDLGPLRDLPLKLLELTGMKLNKSAAAPLAGKTGLAIHFRKGTFTPERFEALLGGKWKPPTKKDMQRPAWIPAVGKRKPAPSSSHVGAGALLAPGEAWPCCASCNAPMPLYVQVRLEETPGLLEASSGVLQWFHCIRCGQGDLLRMLEGTPIETAPPAEIAAEGGAPAPALITKLKPKADCPDESDAELIFDAQLEDLAPTFRGAKLGGWPAWAQDAEWPHCPDCGERMMLLLQTEGGDDLGVCSPEGISFGFGCAKHPSRTAMVHQAF